MTKKQYLFKIAEDIYELLGEKVKKIEVSSRYYGDTAIYAYTVYLNVDANEQDRIQKELDALAKEKSKGKMLQIKFRLCRHDKYRVREFINRPPFGRNLILDVNF